jgi:hypothetical protein
MSRTTGQLIQNKQINKDANDQKQVFLALVYSLFLTMGDLLEPPACKLHDYNIMPPDLDQVKQHTSLGQRLALLPSRC